MYFGTYLLNEKIINEEQLVKTVAYQQECMPSLLRVIQENNILDPKTLVSVIDKLSSSEKDVSSLIIEDQILDKVNFQKARDIQKSMAKGLGQCFVDLGYLKINDVENHINNYLTIKKESGDEVKPVVAEKPTPVKEESIVNEAALESLKELETETNSSVEEEDSGISAAALESLKELGAFSEDEISALSSGGSESESSNSELENEFTLVEKMTDSFVEEYTGTYSEKIKTKLDKITRFIKETANSGGDIANFFNSLYRDIHVLKGVATLVESKTSEKILESLELIIEGLFSKSNDELKVWVDNNLALLKSSLEVLWEIRMKISKEKNENSLWIDDDWKEKFLDIYKRLKDLNDH